MRAGGRQERLRVNNFVTQARMNFWRPEICNNTKSNVNLSFSATSSDNIGTPSHCH